MIIDASVAIKWLVPEDGSDAAAALVGESDLVAPTLLHVEVGNALWKKARRGEIVLAEVLAEMDGLPNLVRTLDETPFASRAVTLAAELAHPVYDCTYLALAMALDDVVLTADERFLAAVNSTEYEARVKSL